MLFLTESEGKDLSLHTHTRLTALCLGLPGWASVRKVKPIWILLKQQTVSGSGIIISPLPYHPNICKSAPRCRQITTPASHNSVFYRLDALPAAQPTASMHWRLITSKRQIEYSSSQQASPLRKLMYHMGSQRWHSCLHPSNAGTWFNDPRGMQGWVGLASSFLGLPTDTHTHTRLTALCPGLPGWAGTRKLKPIWILLKQETMSGSGIHWAICKSAPRSRQLTTPAPRRSVFYRPDALPAAQPTASKHWRQMVYPLNEGIMFLCCVVVLLWLTSRHV